jgi:AcrR family transcriptional regulator
MRSTESAALLPIRPYTSKHLLAYAGGERVAAADETRVRILDAALELFSKHGFKGTTTRSIASEAGVNEVTLFRHFGSKERLFFAVVEHETDITDQLEEARVRPGDDMVEDLTTLGENMAINMAGKAKLMKMIMVHVAEDPEMWTWVSHVPMQILGFLTDYFEEAKRRRLTREDLDPYVAAVGFFSFFFRSLVATAFLGSDIFIPMERENIRKFVEIFVKGIER